MVHYSSAFLAAHAVGGSFRHADFVFGSAGALMRSGQPFHEFGHDLQCKVCLGKRRWIISAGRQRGGTLDAARWLSNYVPLLRRLWDQAPLVNFMGHSIPFPHVDHPFRL